MFCGLWFVDFVFHQFPYFSKKNRGIFFGFYSTTNFSEVHKTTNHKTIETKLMVRFRQQTWRQ